ncbi:MAG: toxin-antitoxin system HicB family antitoxin [Caldilinea sp.]
MNSEKDLGYYLSLPYTIELIREDDTTWFARVVELPGCITEGDSGEDTFAMIQDAMAGWIDIALEDGRVIPEPRPTDEYSGKFVVRVSKSLHRDLVDAAAREEVSLNQFIATELARSVGRQTIKNTDAPAFKNDSDTYWPGLLSGMRSILASAGYKADANAIDERLCAGWFEQRMEMIGNSLAVNMIQDAMNHIDRDGSSAGSDQHSRPGRAPPGSQRYCGGRRP